MSKIAYLVFAYRNPHLLRRAIKTLATERCAFFVHIDHKIDIGQFSSIRGENVFFTERRVVVHWGEFSGVDAILLLIRVALARPEAFDHFVLLSGSDYPLRSGQYIQTFLDENQGSEFISMLKMPSPGKPISRINTVRFESDRPVSRLAWRALAKVGLARRDYKKCLRGLEPYSGITWWTLSRSACEYVLRFIEANPHIERFFRDTFAPEEAFIHTILGNSPLRSRIRGHLTYEDWTDDGPHPTAFLNSAYLIARLKGRKDGTARTPSALDFGAFAPPPRMLTSQHVAIFEAKQKVWLDDVYGSREALFARKFSDQTLDVIDQIDEMIKRKEMKEPVQCRCEN